MKVLLLSFLFFLASCSTHNIHSRKIASNSDEVVSIFEDSLARNNINYDTVEVNKNIKDSTRDLVENAATIGFSLGRDEHKFESYSLKIYNGSLLLKCLGAVYRLDGRVTGVTIGECRAENSKEKVSKQRNMTWKYTTFDKL